MTSQQATATEERLTLEVYLLVNPHNEKRAKIEKRVYAPIATHGGVAHADWCEAAANDKASATVHLWVRGDAT